MSNDLNDVIQKAIDSGNYNNLKRDVTDTFENTVKSIFNMGTGRAENPPVKVNLGGKNGKKTVTINPSGNSVKVDKFYADRVRKPNASGKEVGKTGIDLSNLSFDEKYISGVRLWFGGFTRVFLGALGPIMLMFSTDMFINRDMGNALFGLIAGLPLTYLLGKGISMFHNRRKFKIYRRVLSLSGTKDYASIEDLAQATRESKKKTLKRVKMMIDKNWFKEGYLDRFENTLMTSNESYKLYKTSEQGFEERQKVEKEKEEKRKEDKAGLPKEVREMLETGSAYIKEMQELNDRIPGKEVSDKISKIEGLTARILSRVESHPESVAETKQLMKYYLPMMIKLLHAYADMDEQPKAGQNIEKSKREIEGVLDELNLAFEKLLDDLYKDTAWDVASDISVLNAMLKRGGLKESDFKPIKDMVENEAESQNITLKV